MSNPWSPEFTPPEVLDTARVHLEPLSPVHTELDFEAFMGSREHLRRTLHWGEWPRPNYTVEENRGDLQGHWDEFVRREAYAYTVLAPDKKKCVGCVYMNPWEGPGEKQPGMNLRYWVIEEELATDLDTHLLSSVLDWVKAAWPFEAVMVAVHRENQRGVQVVSEVGLDLASNQDRPDHEAYVWRRG